MQSLRDATAKYAGCEVETANDADTLERPAGRPRALARSPRPTALICVNDVLAVGRCARPVPRASRAGGPVGTGFDNVTLAQFAVPALTTVTSPRADRRTICACLMRDDVPREQSSWSSGVVVRDSTGPAPADLRAYLLAGGRRGRKCTRYRRAVHAGGGAGSCIDGTK